jgi:hypothetical protein
MSQAEPTKEDAGLYLELLAISQQPVQAEARRWVFSEFEARSFEELQSKYPSGTPERDRLVNVLMFYESAGVLISRGLLHEDVFFDAPFELEVLWPLVENLLEDWQKAKNEPAIFENVVWLAKRYEAWHDDHWKPKLEAVPPGRDRARAEPSIRGFSQS